MIVNFEIKINGIFQGTEHVIPTLNSVHLSRQLLWVELSDKG